MEVSFKKVCVSVLLPVFNAQRFVASAIESILHQTFPDFELIIIDDGSTDDSLNTIRRTVGDDKRVRVISRPNTGYVVALNQALGLARGEFVARMDADDISLPERFEKQVAYLRANRRCVLVGSSVIHMDVDGAMIGPMADIEYSHHRIDQALLTGGWPIVHPAVMMRTGAVREVGGYNEDFWPNEDHDLFLKLAEIGRLENIRENLLQYRKHGASVTATNTDRTKQLVNRIIIEACRRRRIAVPAEVLHPRAGVERNIVDIERNWAWKAMKHNYISTARKYALSSLRRRPLSIHSWRLTYCAVRGY